MNPLIPRKVVVVVKDDSINGTGPERQCRRGRLPPSVRTVNIITIMSLDNVTH